jgi:hypothetical protein
VSGGEGVRINLALLGADEGGLQRIEKTKAGQVSGMDRLRRLTHLVQTKGDLAGHGNVRELAPAVGSNQAGQIDPVARLPCDPGAGDAGRRGSHAVSSTW